MTVVRNHTGITVQDSILRDNKFSDGFCGSCRHFQEEDTDGYGWCSLLEKVKFCGNNWCPAWKKKEDDNSLIHSNSLESGKEACND